MGILSVHEVHLQNMEHLQKKNFVALGYEEKVKTAETNRGKTTTQSRFATPRCFLLSDTWGRTQKEARVTTNRSSSLT